METGGKTAFRYIGIGLLLPLITLNAAFAALIQTSIGCIFLLLGFRMIKDTNAWFRVGFTISKIRMAAFIIYLIFLSAGTSAEPLLYIPIVVSLLLHFISLAALNYGIKSEMEKQQPSQRISGLSILIFLCLFFSLYNTMHADHTNTFLSLLLFILYIVLIFRLVNVFRHINQWGQEIKISKSKIGNGLYSICIAFLLFVITTTGCYMGTKDKIKSEPFQLQTDAGILQENSNIPAEFYETGRLLSKSDLDLLKDAGHVEHRAAAVNKDIGNIAVEEWFFYLPGGQVYGMNSFTMPDSGKIHFLDSMIVDLYFNAIPVSGKIFYDNGDKIFSKKMKELENVTKEYDESYMYAQFSFPSNSRAHKGYILYEIIQEMEGEEGEEYLEGFSIQSVTTYHRSSNLYEILWNPTGLDVHVDIDDF